MSNTNGIDFSDNPDFNVWLDENYSVRIEEYEFASSDVLFNMDQGKYIDAFSRYTTDPKVSSDRIVNRFPTPIAYYFYQATNNYQNDHHRLDLLKSCWESIVYFLFGLVIGEARHRKLDLKSRGMKWPKYWSNKLFDKLTIVENILDYVTTTGITFGCSSVIPISTLSLIKKLNQERNGFEHAAAKTAAQQKALYSTLYPQLELVLGKLIKLENVTVFRYHDAETPLYPRCEIFNSYSLEGKKNIVPLQKDNYVAVLDHFNADSVFAKIENEIFCLEPFIHFCQETHETNAIICFYKQDKGGQYQFEIVSKSQNKAFDKATFCKMEDELRSLIV